jgi:TrmH family RNA methyltransferase
VITSTANSHVQWIRDLQRKRRMRREEGLFVIEGIRLAEEAFRAGATPRLVVHGQHLDPRASSLVAGFAGRGAAVLLVSDHVLAACASTESPQGLAAVMPIPEIPLPTELSLAVVVDGLADPGNLGTLLRTSLAAGVEAVFLCSGTVDAYNPKVVRGGMGAHFRLPIQSASPEEVLRRLSGLAIWTAEPQAGLAYDRLDGRRPLALVIGGEARGPSEIWRGKATGTISIPTAGEVESLNAAVAAAVILFEIRRQRRTP